MPWSRSQMMSSHGNLDGWLQVVDEGRWGLAGFSDGAGEVGG